MTDTHLTITQEEERGKLIARVLGLKPSKIEQGRYMTEWGTKTAIGLYRTVKRLVEEGG